MDNFQLFTTLRCDLELLKVPDQQVGNVGWNENPSPFYMLDFHRDRMFKAAVHWGWHAAIKTLEGHDGLRNLEAFLQTNVPEITDSPQRTKILLGRDGVLSVEKGPTDPARLSNLFPPSLPAPQSPHVMDSTLPERNFEFEVLVDKQSTAKTEFTHFKTTHRAMYDDARLRASILKFTDKTEVLLFNKDDGSIMEGSLTTPYFFRHGVWVTPPIPSEFDITQGSGGNNGTTRRWALERGLVVEEVVHASSIVDGEECWISNGVRGFVHGKVRLV